MLLTRWMVQVPPMLRGRRMLVMRPMSPEQRRLPMPLVPPTPPMPQTPPVQAIPPTLPTPLAREQQARTQPPHATAQMRHATAPQQPTRPPPARSRPPAPQGPMPPEAQTQSHIPHRTSTTQRVAWPRYAGCATFPGAHRFRCNAVLLSSSSDCGSDVVRIDHGAAAIKGVA
jgi:hypothetical protein